MKTNTFTALLISGVLLLTSCGGRENIHDLDKPGEAVAIQKKIIENVEDLETYEIRMSSQGELETSIDRIIVVSENNEATVLKTSCQVLGSGDTTSEIEDNKFFVKNYMKNGSKKISEIDFDLVQKNFEDAKKLIPEEYITPKLNVYTIKFKDNKRADTFTINTLLKDEGDHMEGRDIITNYYEFIFSMKEDGSLSLN